MRIDQRGFLHRKGRETHVADDVDDVSALRELVLEQGKGVRDRGELIECHLRVENAAL